MFLAGRVELPITYYFTYLTYLHCYVLQVPNSATDRRVPWSLLASGPKSVSAQVPLVAIVAIVVQLAEMKPSMPGAVNVSSRDRTPRQRQAGG